MYFRLFVPSQNATASVIFFDLWNPTGSGFNIEVIGVCPIKVGAVVTGTFAIETWLQRTSAIGTGGTGATVGGTATNACTFVPYTAQMTTMPGGISARLTPSGGATAAGIVAYQTIPTEDTIAEGHFNAEMLKRGQAFPDLVVPQNSGISVVEASTASPVGALAWDVMFRLRQAA